MPSTEDGNRELRDLDQRVALHAGRLAPRPAPIAELTLTIQLFLDHAAIWGQLADYQAALALSERLIAEYPKQADAWKARTRVLGRVHRFAEARAALATLRKLAPDQGLELDTLGATLDEATGNLAASRPVRERAVADWANPETLTLLAYDTSLAGDLDGALALMDRAHQAMRYAMAIPLAWMLFQWGRLYEQKGESAAARAFYQEALVRLPHSLEPQTHLAQLLIAAGERAAAAKMVDEALANNRHPELLALAAELAPPAAQAEAKRVATAAWEAYLAALPEAFSDHGARFFLGVGGDPARAVTLARANLANRDTREARALVVEAALAAHDPNAACEVVDPLIAPPALRAQRFLAWRALSTCGRPEAAALGRELGIK
jgi:tetratricopeptide (TPR) repeat protein